MKNLIAFLIVFAFAIKSIAQTRHYQAFGWQGNYGIVDSARTEIVPPSYPILFSSLAMKSPYIVLQDEQEKALIVHSQTGVIDSLDYLSQRTWIFVDDKAYLFAKHKGMSYLVNNNDLTLRIALPKNYIGVLQTEDYLLGVKEKKGDIISVDFISKHDLKIKKKEKLRDIKAYKDEEGQWVYLIHKRKATLFLDAHLKKIASTNKILKGFDEAKGFLAKKRGIHIVEDIPAVGTAVVPHNYPYLIRDKYKSDNSYEYYEIQYEDQETNPFFKFKKLDESRYEILNYARDNKLLARARDAHANEFYFMFYFDVKKRIIYFPKKYGATIGLEMVQPDDSSLLGQADRQAEYPGGINAFRQYFAHNFNTPDDAVGGKFIITFVVEKDGTLTNFKVENELTKSMTQEAFRVIRKSPKWKPAIENGRPIKMIFRFPVSMQIAD